MLRSAPDLDDVDDRLVDISLNVMFAGRDTTSVLLAWTFYELRNHEHKGIRLKAIEEIEQHIHDLEAFEQNSI